MKIQKMFSAIIVFVGLFSCVSSAAAQSGLQMSAPDANSKGGLTPSECELRTRQAKADAEGVSLDQIQVAPIVAEIGESNQEPVEVSIPIVIKVSLQGVFGYEGGEKMVDFYLENGLLSGEDGVQFVEYSGFTLDLLMDRFLKLQGKSGISSVSVSQDRLKYSIDANGLSLELLLATIKNQLEDQQ